MLAFNSHGRVLHRFADLDRFPMGASLKIGLDLALYVRFGRADHFQWIESTEKRGSRKIEPKRPCMW